MLSSYLRVLANTGRMYVEGQQNEGSLISTAGQAVGREVL